MIVLYKHVLRVNIIEGKELLKNYIGPRTSIYKIPINKCNLETFNLQRSEILEHIFIKKSEAKIMGIDQFMNGMI